MAYISRDPAPYFAFEFKLLERAGTEPYQYSVYLASK